jgi:NADH-quinone oxidoreductase subunit N
MPFEIDYLALGPEIAVALTVMAVLTLDLLLPKSQKYWTGVVAVVGMMAAAVPLIALIADGTTRTMLDGSWVVDPFALALKAVFLAAGYLVLLMSVGYIESDRYYEGEYYYLLLSSILGSLALASSRDFITMFIALELVTAPLFLLSGWRKGDSRSNESALKFFLIGVLSAAMLGWGMSFVYGLTGTVNFTEISGALGGLLADDAMRPAAVLAVLFVMTGFAFKISAVPFHFWAPDTYEGAPTPVTAYLSVSSKAAGFVGLLVVCYQAFASAQEIWAPTLWILAALSMTLGNLSALNQTNIVRLLAYSSVAQAGFMLVPFGAAAVAGADLAQTFSATIIYIVIYAFMNLGAFGIVIAGSRRTGSGLVSSFAGFGTRAPGLAFLAAIFFFSLAGIPPLAGWYAKFAMFSSVIAAGETWAVTLAVIAAINAVIAFYYYARVIKTMWFDPAPDAPEKDVKPISGSLQLAIGLATVMTFVLGVLPGLADSLGRAAQL